MKQLIAAFLLIPLFSAAQNTDSAFIKKIADDVLVNGKAYDELRELTKTIGGRLAGSPQMVKAENWGAAAMKKLGADTVYLQECMVPHWVRGGKDKVSIITVDGQKVMRPLAALALGNSMGSGPKGVTAQVMAVESFAELESRKNEVKGKIVFYNAHFNSTNIIPLKSYGETGIYRYNGPSRAAKYGAVAVLIRSLTEATNNNPHTGVMRYNDSFPKIPAAALGLEDADYLWNLCKEKREITTTLTTAGHYLPDTTGHNVIAELKGSSLPETFITIGGHLDSWDVNEGASDDGTGVVQTMEVLRVLKAIGYKPKSTLRFVLFANEENGSRGGKKYTEAAKANNEKHLFAIESDDGGFTPRGFSFTMDSSKLTTAQAWKPLLEPYGSSLLTAGGSGADVEPLHETLNTPAAGFVPDNQRYFDLHHSAGDVFEAVNKRELLLGAINIAGLIYLVDQHGL